MNKLLDNWVPKLMMTIITVVVLFLLNSWLNSFEAKIVGLQGSFEKNTAAIEALDETLDDLRWESGDNDGDIIEKLSNFKETLKDHETRLRELEKR